MISAAIVLDGASEEPTVSVETSVGSLVDFAHDELHRLITDGELAEGDRIVIDRFAKQFGTSLIPIREALARLHAEGLATFERNKGYRVAARPTMAELQRLFEARLVIEVGAAELALKLSSRVFLDDLKAINRLIAKGSYGTTFQGFREFVTLNERFHVELVALANNPLLDEAYQRLGYHQKITRATYGHGPGDIKRIVREHNDIIDALAEGEPDALRRAVTGHITSGLDRVSGTRLDGAASRGPYEESGRAESSRPRPHPRTSPGARNKRPSVSNSRR
jgi:DNA-binding GntR family transcriptional regulator